MVDRIIGGPSGYELVFDRGGSMRADVAVVAVGTAPVTEWLADVAPLAIEDGVLTNEYCETSMPGVFAAGDCARWPDRGLDCLIRTEHWDCAIRHGKAAAASMMGLAEPFSPVHFAWSIQHRVRLQWVGATTSADRVDIEEIGGSGFMARYWRANALRGAFAIDAPRALARVRRLLEKEALRRHSDRHDPSSGGLHESLG
jgi:NADPH-dependent 2,4-dienoyl-CoA reductase/sulfur reductase-like enzyme